MSFSERNLIADLKVDLKTRFLRAFLPGLSLDDKFRFLLHSLFVRVRSELVARNMMPTELAHSLDRIMNGLIRGVRIRIDGVKYVLVDSESFSLVSPEHESWLWKHLDVKENEVFLDVGAHIGKYALRIAKTVKNSKVVAVEAHPQKFGALRTGVKLNGLDNVIALNLAAWNAKERQKLYLAAFAGRHSMKANMCLGYVLVEAEPLDQTLKRIGIDAVDWIKIDVEDAENEVLRGLADTIKHCKPHIIFESRNIELYERSREYLEQYEYVCEKIAFDNYIAIPNRTISASKQRPASTTS